MDTGSTFRAGSNTLRIANYFASGTGEDNAGTEMTMVSTSDLSESNPNLPNEFWKRLYARTLP